MSDDNQIDSLTVGVGIDSSDFKRGQQEIDSGLDQIEKSADDAASSVDNLGDKAGKTGKDLSDLGGKSSEASQGVESLGQSAESTAENVESLGNTSEGATTNVDNLGSTAEQAANGVGELGEASQTAADKIQELQDQINELQEDAENAADEIAELQDELDNLSQSGGKTGKSLGSHFDQVTRSVRGLANEVMALMALNKVASVASGKGIGGTVAAGVTEQASLGRQAHNLNISPTKLAGWELTAEKFGGSQQEAQQFMQRIQDMITSNKIDAGQLSPLLTRYVDLHNPDGSMKSAERIAFEILKVLHEKANDPLAPNDINYAIRQSFGGGPGIVEMARLGPERLQRELEAAEARSRVTAQGTEEVTRFSQALAEARQQVAGFGTGLLEQLSKYLGPFLEDLNKNHPGLVGAGGTALTIGAPLAGMAILRKWLVGARAAGAAGAGAGAAGAAGGGALSGLAVAGMTVGGLLAPGNLLGDKAEADSTLSKRVGTKDENGNNISVEVWKPDDSDWESIPLKRRKDIQDQLAQYADNGLDTEQQILTLPTVEEQQAVVNHYRRLLWSKTGGRSELENQLEADRQQKSASQTSPAIGLPLANDTGKSRYSGKVPKALEDMQDYLRQLEDQHGLPKGLLTEIAIKESGGNPNAVSRRDGKIVARGMFQFTPGTAMQHNLANPHDPMESARAAAEFYGQLSKDFGGDIDKMMASYNSGPGKVQQISRNFGDRWRDWLGPEGQGYVNYEQAPGANKLLQYVARHSKLRADRALAVFPINGDAQQDYSQMQVPQQLQEQVNPALSPAVQQASIRNDNRRVTNTVHIDNMPITAPGGTSKEIALGMRSALQRHPLRIDGSDYG